MLPTLTLPDGKYISILLLLLAFAEKLTILGLIFGVGLTALN